MSLEEGSSKCPDLGAKGRSQEEEKARKMFHLSGERLHMSTLLACTSNRNIVFLGFGSLMASLNPTSTRRLSRLTVMASSVGSKIDQPLPSQHRPPEEMTA